MISSDLWITAEYKGDSKAGLYALAAFVYLVNFLMFGAFVFIVALAARLAWNL